MGISLANEIDTRASVFSSRETKHLRPCSSSLSARERPVSNIFYLAEQRTRAPGFSYVLQLKDASTFERVLLLPERRRPALPRKDAAGVPSTPARGLRPTKVRGSAEPEPSPPPSVPPLGGNQSREHLGRLHLRARMLPGWADPSLAPASNEAFLFQHVFFTN